MSLPVKPATRTGWWGFGLGVAAVAWGLFATSIPMMIRQMIPEDTAPPLFLPIGLATVAVAVLLAISAIVVGIRSIRSGDRSVLLFLGFVPGLVVGGFWIVFAIGEVLIPH